MVINIHAGHNPDGKTACGAVGMILESTEARKVKDRLYSLLKERGCEVYDCTVEDGTSQLDVLQKIVQKCNAHTVDLDVSIHFNSGRYDTIGDCVSGGVEVYTFSNESKALPAAKHVTEKIAEAGFRNRGTKVADFYVLRKTKVPAMLVECCFVDDADDIQLYQADRMAQAIADGMIVEQTKTTQEESNDAQGLSSKQEEVAQEQVEQALKQPVTPVSQPPYYVKIRALTLNIRASNSVTAKIKGVVRNQEVYTIVETKGTWGRLKSGAGWISISTKYVQYL